MIQTQCYLLETLLTPQNTPPDTAKDIYELYFVFAAIWAFGGYLFQDQVCGEGEGVGGGGGGVGGGGEVISTWLGVVRKEKCSSRLLYTA